MSLNEELRSKAVYVCNRWAELEKESAKEQEEKLEKDLGVLVDQLIEVCKTGASAGRFEYFRTFDKHSIGYDHMDRVLAGLRVRGLYCAKVPNTAMLVICW